jgi:transcription-repair coupling factor (superfamily II helicase)
MTDFADSQSLREGLLAIERLLDSGARDLRLVQCRGALLAYLAARLAGRLPSARRPLVVVAASEESAVALTRDLGFFLPARTVTEDPVAAPRVLHLAHEEITPWTDLSPDRRLILDRMATLFRLSQNLAGDVLVTSPGAIARKVIARDAFSELADVLQAKEKIDRDATLQLLVRGGYQRLPVVEDPGTYAVRGGVVDVFVPIYRFPLRLELFGDELESIRFFDPATQRTLREIDEVYLHPVRETIRTRGHRLRERLLEAGDHAAHPSSKTRAILEQIERGEDFFGMEALMPAFHERLAPLSEYLPRDPLFIVEEPDTCIAAVREAFTDGEEQYETRIAEHRIAFPPSDFLLNGDELSTLLGGGTRVESLTLEVASEPAAPTVRLRVEEHGGLAGELLRARAEKHEELLRPLVALLERYREEGTRVLLAVPGLSHAERLESLLKGYHIEPRVERSGSIDLLDEKAQRTAPEIVLGGLGRGFHLPLDHVAIITEGEIFGEKAARKAATKKARGAFKPDDFKNLEVGAHVVHAVHGVGVYKGLTKLPLRGASGSVDVDFLHLEYDGGALYLPVWRLNEVQAYAGAEGLSPRLDRLGGQSWEKTKSRVTKEIRQMAEELLQLYAQRKALPGHPYVLDAHAEQLFREFEATFPFEETPDQQKAIDDVLADLELPRPMDRLVCGDVGYGKTEVAVRAALKCVLGGKQVAVLAPTTVLVEQHALTFAARFRDLPVKVASLSRFRTTKEQAEVAKGLAEGKVDVVVGTHRLLSADVRFKDLGVIIVDEEQRFGVAHKERLKKLKTQVDVLTLTATPIPRTLHMALMGLREISVITTPPADRLAVRTLVGKYNDALVVEGVKRELQRGGQIFFVHNRVQDIHEWSAKLRELMPELRIVVGHGQMAPEELEKVMVEFVDGKADLLLCTTIVESGLDIPRANTMFVNRADCLGLAQLYQLRGRIGRSRERAFCYLLIPPEDSLTQEAKQRLAVLQRFTELGAGFQIASHDLEIRGAGDLLGQKQSGAIAAVGFETYTQILEEAVASLKGEPITHERDPELTCDLPGFLPEIYCPDVGQRLEFYRRFSLARDEEEIEQILGELGDRYGTPPGEVHVLAGIMVVKSLGRRLGAKAIELGEVRLSLALGEDTPLQPAQVMKLVNTKNSPWKLTPDMRLQRALSTAERGERLAVSKRLLSELVKQSSAAESSTA